MLRPCLSYSDAFSNFHCTLPNRMDQLVQVLGDFETQNGSTILSWSCFTDYHTLHNIQQIHWPHKLEVQKTIMSFTTLFSFSNDPSCIDFCVDHPNRSYSSRNCTYLTCLCVKSALTHSLRHRSHAHSFP